MTFMSNLTIRTRLLIGVLVPVLITAGTVAWITLLAIAGFSPIPFKLLTITSGFVHFNIIYFIIISLITRGSRFFLISFLVGNFGSAMKKIIEKKLLKFSIILSIVLIIFAYLIYKFLINFIS